MQSKNFLKTKQQQGFPPPSTAREEQLASDGEEDSEEWTDEEEEADEEESTMREEEEESIGRDVRVRPGASQEICVQSESGCEWLGKSMSRGVPVDKDARR